MVIIWFKLAQKDLKDYVQNSKLVTEGKAQKYAEKLIDYIDSLEQFPNLGKEFITYRTIIVRQLLYKMHRIFYFIKDDKIVIIHVTHYARSIENVMKSLKKYMEEK